MSMWKGYRWGFVCPLLTTDPFHFGELPLPQSNPNPSPNHHCPSRPLLPQAGSHRTGPTTVLSPLTQRLVQQWAHCPGQAIRHFPEILPTTILSGAKQKEFKPRAPWVQPQREGSPRARIHHVKRCTEKLKEEWGDFQHRSRSQVPFSQWRPTPLPFLQHGYKNQHIFL